MLVTNFASFIFLKRPMAARVLFQSGSGAQRFDLWQMWTHMQWPALGRHYPAGNVGVVYGRDDGPIACFSGGA